MVRALTHELDAGSDPSKVVSSQPSMYTSSLTLNADIFVSLKNDGNALVSEAPSPKCRTVTLPLCTTNNKTVNLHRARLI